MTDWKELYQQKLIPVEDIAKILYGSIEMHD